MNLDKTGKSDKTGTTNKDIKYDDILLGYKKTIDTT